MKTPMRGPDLNLSPSEQDSLWAAMVLIAKMLVILALALLVGLVSWLFLPLAVVAAVVVLKVPGGATKKNKGSV